MNIAHRGVYPESVEGSLTCTAYLCLANIINLKIPLPKGRGQVRA